MADWTSAEINQMLQLRAIEWCNWPAYISLASVPVLFIWVKWWVVILGVFLANALWACIRHRVHSLRLANTVAMIVAPGQWVVAVVCVIVQLISRHWGLAAISGLWPLLGSLVYFPGGKIGLIEANFAKEIGLIDENPFVN
jgi:hypothetical protein